MLTVTSQYEVDLDIKEHSEEHENIGMLSSHSEWFRAQMLIQI